MITVSILVLYVIQFSLAWFVWSDHEEDQCYVVDKKAEMDPSDDESNIADGWNHWMKVIFFTNIANLTCIILYVITLKKYNK